MATFIAKRLLGLLFTLFLVITISFIVVRLAPGNPFSGERALPPEIMANVLKSYNLDKPLYQQYFIYLKNIVFHFDFGPSFKLKDFTVGELVALGLPVSATLGVSVLLVSLFFSIILGSLAALNQYKKIDYAITGTAIALNTIPGFVLAPVFVLLFAVYLGWFPVSGWYGASYAVLPVLSLALPTTLGLTRLVRNSLLEVLSSNYIRTAYAKGLTKKTVLLKHAFKAAALPVVTVLGPIAAGAFVGSFVIESLFSIPGVGRYLVQATTNRDYSLLMGCVIVASVLILTMNLIVDLTYAWLDPRVKLNK